jgi:AbrB family looped-hinge helix DNA binding protein
MTYKLGPKGQVVIPKTIRDHLGLQPGDELTVVENDGEIRISKAVSARDLIGIFADGPSLTAALEAGRREDRALEDGEDEEWRAARRP